ncbi:MAG: HD-GYP domain-containing protein [Pseudomonadota bacterium]
MITKIPVNSLRLGMHIQEFEGTWMDHPFWRGNFIVRTTEELDRIVTGGVREVWIDTERSVTFTAGAVPPKPPAETSSRPAPPSARALKNEAMDDAAISKALDLYRSSVPRIAELFAQARMGNAVDGAACDALVDEISESVMNNPGALISVARLKRRDEYTYMHSVTVCALMLSLGRQIGLPEAQLRAAGLAGMLHDLGKAMMPLDVLNKPGKLTDAEFDIIKSHPERGHALLVEGGSVGPEVLEVCLHHHEKMDGSGYPHGLAGDGIGLFARMAAICDVYDAITSIRPYKTGWDPGEALRRMAQWKGHFDPKLFQAFVKTMGIYPVGTLVRLQSGRLAVVTQHNPKALLSPKVKAFYSTNSDLRIVPQLIDLAGAGCQDKVASWESPTDWSFNDLEQLWGAPQPRR